MGDIQTSGDPRTKGKKCNLMKLVQDVRFNIYCAHSITTWGDRMWMFAVGLFLIQMSPGSLYLPAIYGVVSCACIIAFGAPVGRWVDCAPRLSVARTSLIVQNTLVALCSALLCLVFIFKDDFKQRNWHWAMPLSQVTVIGLTSLGNVASMASTISISKDWVVVVANNDKDSLAQMNAMCRRIDLLTKICSPLLVGNIMSLVSNVAAAAFIAGWNVLSMGAEYYFLLRIYHKVPALAAEKNAKLNVTKMNPEPSAEDEVEIEELMNYSEESPEKAAAVISVSNVTPQNNHCCNSICKKVSSYISMWRTYFSQDVMPAGLGLACLYLTVLGFDNITAGYSYSQGVSEWVLGLLGGIGAIVGILGTLAYPLLQRKVGIIRTGLFGFASEVACLTLCIFSVWAPGSPFDPSSLLMWSVAEDTPDNHIQSNFSTQLNLSSSPSMLNDSTGFMEWGNTTTAPIENQGKFSYMSVTLLMTGILMARFGLWLADLTVNQLLQQEVHESERGVVNGVQYALNTIMDLAKYGLVILMPKFQSFGFLVIISYTFICLGWASYAVYARRKRGHILPFRRVFKRLFASTPIEGMNENSPQNKDLK